MNDPDALARQLKRIADLVERQVVPALGRIAAALEARPAGGSVSDARSSGLAGLREAIDAGRWGEAERRLRAFVTEFPDDRAAGSLRAEIDAGRAVAAGDLRAQLDAARGVGDHGRVIDLRDELADHLPAGLLAELDRELVVWLMGLVRKGLGEIPLRLDVVELASRVADRFAATKEGASLTRALPVLRRSVGLCPRCARPYAGEDEACPECLAPTLADLPPAPGDELAARPRPSWLEEAGVDDVVADDDRPSAPESRADGPP